MVGKNCNNELNMKKLFFAILVFVSCSASAQTIKIFDHSAWNVNGKNISFLDGTDSIMRIKQTWIKIFKPITINVGSDASYDMYYRDANGIFTRIANGTTGQVLTATTSAAPSWSSAGSGVTGTGTAGRVSYWDGTSSINSNSTFLWDNTNARLSVGTTTASAGLNVGGNRTWGGATSGIQALFAAATYNDNVTGASGTASSNPAPILFGSPTFTATNSNVTITNATTVFIDKPIASTNILAITNNRALVVNGPTEMKSAVFHQVNGATDATYTVTTDDYYVTLVTITANRTVTLPSASANTGRMLVLRNINSAGFAWQFSVAVKDGADASVTNLVNDTVYQLMSDGTTWNIIN